MRPQGVVVTRHGKQCRVRLAEHSEDLLCPIRPGIGQPVVGDRVEIDSKQHGTRVVTAIVPRRNVLSRVVGGRQDKPLAANLDDIVIVFAPEPPPSAGLLDNYLVAASMLGARPTLVRNKSDINGADTDALLARYRRIGYTVLTTDAKANNGIAALAQRLAGREGVLVGQSGVGKSTLLNCLLPGASATTGAVSEQTGLGRHTTSTATLHLMPNGGMLVDSPGVRSFELGKIAADEAATAFPELRPHLGHCRFPNCTHLHEPDCAVRAAVEAGQILPERYASYQRICGAQ